MEEKRFFLNIVIDDTYGFREMPRICKCLAPTLRAERDGLKVVEQIIVDSRGRNPMNTSDRTPGCPTEQRLEPNLEGICNTLTTVQKDSLVLEKEPRVHTNAVFGRSKAICDIAHSKDEIEYLVRKRDEYIEKNNLPNKKNLNNETKGDGRVDNTEHGSTRYRIRKLTPKECWRLMDFSDEDFEKAAAVNSNTNLYKQAGNSIVCNVLVAIMGQMFPGKEDEYRKRAGQNFFNQDI